MQEVKENNCNLIETVTEQQTVIDMLAQVREALVIAMAQCFIIIVCVLVRTFYY